MSARKRAKDAISVIEAAYAIDEPEAAWLSGLVTAAGPNLEAGLGLCAYTYDARQIPFRIGTVVSRGPDVLPGLVRRAVELGSLDQDYVNRTWRSLSFATVSETVDMQTVEAARGFVEAGMNDILVVNAYDPSGMGVWVGAPLPHQRRLTAAERRVWHRIASHLASAFRLRSRSSSSLERSAVLTPQGRVEHAEGDATLTDSRAALRDAVLRMERARGPKRRRDPEDAVSDWRTRVDARWSLLDQFDSDGRRYIVAVENQPSAYGPERLSERERQVLAAAATGRSNKVIAYELGLSDSTIRVLLFRVFRKLEVTSRSEAVALYLAHSR